MIDYFSIQNKYKLKADAYSIGLFIFHEPPVQFSTRIAGTVSLMKTGSIHEPDIYNVELLGKKAAGTKSAGCLLL